MLASEIIARYEAYCPQELSMEGDISGLQIGTLDKEVYKVLVALDIREQTVVEAIELGAGLIIVKHAPIFRPLKDLVAEAGQQTLTEQEKRFGSFLLEQQSPVFRKKWQKELKKFEEALAHIPEKNQLERSAMSQKIESIKEVLHASK